jgi:hypothetical protein
MAETRKKRPRDPIALAKLIGDLATGQTEDVERDERDTAAVALGRRGGLKGGKARWANLTPEQRSEAATLAVQARWRKKRS